MNRKTLFALMLFVSLIFSQSQIHFEPVNSNPPRTFLGGAVMLLLLLAIALYIISVLLKAMKKYGKAAQIMVKLAQLSLLASLLGAAVYILAPVIINALLSRIELASVF